MGATLVWSELFGLKIAKSARVCVAVPALKDPTQWEDLEPWLTADATLDELVSQLGDLREAKAPTHVCLRLIHQSKLIAEKEVTLTGEARDPGFVREVLREARKFMEGVNPVEFLQTLRGTILGDAPMRVIAEKYGMKWPATRGEVERVFREQCDKFHPDKIGDTRENNQRFAKIAAHFRVLRDHASRESSHQAQR